MWALDHKEGWVPFEHRRIDAFELWYWRRLLRVPWIARRANQLVLNKSTLNILWKDWCWSWSSNTLATWCKELTHWKIPCCWERLKARGEGDARGRDGWMASPTQWTLVWVNSRSWRWTGNSGMLQSMGSQSVVDDWLTELNYLFWQWDREWNGLCSLENKAVITGLCKIYFEES